MEVRLRVPTALRELTGGQSTLVVAVEEPATVAGLLDAVAATNPALERRLRDERGALRTHVNLFVGADDVRASGGTETRLRPGAEISVLAAISGG